MTFVVGVQKMKWLEDKCRKSSAFAWFIALLGIGLMVLVVII
jgi:hypothetical protein